MIARNPKIQKLISVILIISILVPAVLLGKPKKADALLTGWISDFFAPLTSGSVGISAGQETVQTTLKLKDLAKEVLKEIARNVVKRLLQEMTKSTINWINSGFHGNPLFLENPQSFFRDIAKYEVKNLVTLFGYDSLRYPFGKDFSLNIINSYKRRLADNAAYTLSSVINDPVLLNNYRNDFNVGGWNGFLINTQYPQNNYIGFNMLATEELARRLQGTVQNEAEKIQTTLQQGMGFLSTQTCLSNPLYDNTKNQFQQPKFNQSEYVKLHPYKNPYTCTDTSVPIGDPNYYACQGWKAYDDQYNNDLMNARNAWEAKNTCPGGLVNTTPGAIVGNSIMTALDSNYKQKELAMAMGNSISAILDALLNHFLNKGLSALASKVNPPPPPDDFDYYGNTLGTVTPYNSQGTWDSGPDEEIVLEKFKQAIADG